MKIEVRNLKKTVGREGSGFEATVYIDGVKAGTAADYADGGPVRFTPWELETVINRYAETLPPIVTEYRDPKDPSKFLELQPNADVLVGDAVNRYECRKRFERLAKERLLWVQGGKVYQSKKLTLMDLRRFVANDTGKNGKLLNALPLDEAAELFYQNSGAAS